MNLPNPPILEFDMLVEVEVPVICVGCRKKTTDGIEMSDSQKHICKACIKIIENAAKESYFFVKFTIDEFKD